MHAASLSQLGKSSWEPELGWAALQAPSSQLTSQEPFSPLQPPDPCTQRVFTALWWDSQLYCSIHGLCGLEHFRGSWWHELPLKTLESKMLHALGMDTCPLPCIANNEGRAWQYLSLDKPIPLGSPILLTSPDIWKIWLIFYFTCQCLSKFMNIRCRTS